MVYSQKIQLAFKDLVENVINMELSIDAFNEIYKAAKEKAERDEQEFLKKVYKIDENTKRFNDVFSPFLTDTRPIESSVELELLSSGVKEEKISSLKKRIKHCKNHMERKKLQQELNVLYKERKNVRA